MEKPHVYEQTYKDYLSRIAKLDFPFLADKLGMQLDGRHVIIPFFGKPYRISARVPLLLLFNDKDDEFPAQCSALFEKRTEKFLDMECLAMVGMLFFEYLKAEAGF